MKIGYCVIVTLEGVVLNNMAESCTPSTCEETDTEEKVIVSLDSLVAVLHLRL